MSGREMYSLRVMDHTGTVFYESGKMDDENGDAKPFVATIPINKAGNRLWTFVLQPNRHFYENHPFSTSRFGLLAGLLMAAIIGVAFFFMRKSSRESQQVKLINSRLQSMNMALEEQKRKAEEASRTKSEFLSIMSHEISGNC